MAPQPHTAADTSPTTPVVGDPRAALQDLTHAIRHVLPALGHVADDPCQPAQRVLLNDAINDLRTALATAGTFKRTPPVWVPADPGHLADVVEPERCPHGIEGHTWTLTIEEGTAAFTPREDCTGSCEWDPEYMDNIDLGVVGLRWVPECDNPGGWHGLDARCEHGVWLTPHLIEAGDWPARYTPDLLDENRTML